MITTNLAALDPICNVYSQKFMDFDTKVHHMWIITLKHGKRWNSQQYQNSEPPWIYNFRTALQIKSIDQATTKANARTDFRLWVTKSLKDNDKKTTFNSSTIIQH